eukprot:s690_g17.t1
MCRGAVDSIDAGMFEAIHLVDEEETTDVSKFGNGGVLASPPNPAASLQRPAGVPGSCSNWLALSDMSWDVVGVGGVEVEREGCVTWKAKKLAALRTPEGSHGELHCTMNYIPEISGSRATTLRSDGLPSRPVSQRSSMEADDWAAAGAQEMALDRGEAQASSTTTSTLAAAASMVSTVLDWTNQNDQVNGKIWLGAESFEQDEHAASEGFSNLAIPHGTGDGIHGGRGGEAEEKNLPRASEFSGTCEQGRADQGEVATVVELLINKTKKPSMKPRTAPVLPFQDQDLHQGPVPLHIQVKVEVIPSKINGRLRCRSLYGWQTKVCEIVLTEQKQGQSVSPQQLGHADGRLPSDERPRRSESVRHRWVNWQCRLSEVQAWREML